MTMYKVYSGGQGGWLVVVTLEGEKEDKLFKVYETKTIFNSSAAKDNHWTAGLKPYMNLMDLDSPQKLVRKLFEVNFV